MRLLAVGTVVVGLSAFATLSHPIAHAAGVVITSIDCAPATHPPGGFDIIRIDNTGATPQDLAGWQLTSDPEAAERMTLDIAGTLDPAEQTLIIVAGPHGTAFPADNIFLWSPIGVLRDSGDPADYVRLLDASGAQVSFAACPASAPVPSVAPEAPAAQAGTSGQQSQPASSAQNASASRTAAVHGSGLPATGGPPAQESISGQLALVCGLAALWLGVMLMTAARRRAGSIRPRTDESRGHGHA